MANSIWDVVYGEDRFKGLLGQEGVQATGGGTVYDPTTDYKETRYDNQGNSYLSNPDAPLIPGHTRAGDTPMFESTKVELPPVQSPHDYGSNYYSGKPWTPEVTRPNVQSATIDSLLAQQGVNQVTQQEQDQFNRINASQNRETRYDDQGNPYQVRRDLPLIPGHTRSLEPQSVEPKVDPMSLYNRQGRADYTPQNIVSDEVVEGSPSLGYYPNEAERAYQEEAWYQEQDKIEAQIQELLKGTTLEQQFQQDDFNQRVQDRLSQPTPDWLGQSKGALTDAQREDLNRYTDTDSFGNPLDTDSFGNTNYETNLNRKLDSMNRMAFSGGNTQEQAPTPQQASNTTDFFRDRAQASKKYQDAILNIGDTIGEGVSSLYEGAKDLGSNIDLSGVGESISNVWGDLTKKDDRSFVERMSDTEQNIAQPIREGITDTASTIWEGGKQGADMFIESAKAFGGDVKGVYDTINRLGNDFYTKYIDSPKDAREKGADLGNTLKVASENMNESVAEQLQMLAQIVDEPVEFFQQVANLGEGAIAEYGDDGLLGVGTSKSAIGLGLNRVLENKFPELAEFNKKTRSFLGFESQENQREMAKAMWEQIKQDYGSWEGYKQHVSQNPSQALLELTGLGFMARAGGRAVKSKLNDPEFLDKIDELSRQLPETQMSGSFGRSEMFAGTKGAEALGKTDLLNRAEKLEKTGASKDDIWKYTGFIRGQDGNWRFELDSSKMKLKDDVDIQQFEKGGKSDYSLGYFTLERLIDYPELFSAYPELRTINVKIDKDLEGEMAYTDLGSAREIRIPPRGDTRSILEHEVQHVVQSIEGHATGGSPQSEIFHMLNSNPKYRDLQGQKADLERKGKPLKEFINNGTPTYSDLYDSGLIDLETLKFLQKENGHWLSEVDKPLYRDKAVQELNLIRDKWESLSTDISLIEEKANFKRGYENYRKLGGEVEAREAQNRLNMSNSQRKSTIPTWDKVADEDVILRFANGVNLSSLPWKMSTKGEGDFYITRVGSNAGKVSKTRQSPNDIAFSTDQDVLLPDYAYYAVMNLEKQLKARAHGTAQQSINKKDIDAVLTDFFQNMNKAESVDDGVLGQVGKDYKGTHTAPISEGKNSLDDFSEIFPDNANDPNFARYYGMGGEYAKADAETIAVMKAVQGNPDAEVTIYRAVPKGTKDINAGDWVSTSKDYTKQHGERYIDGDYDIIEKKVRAGDLHTDGDLHEWGYNPSKTDDGVLGQVGKTTKDTVDTLEQQAKKYKTSEDWLRAGGADIDLLDEMAFGFSEKSLKTLSPKDLNIKWKDDMLNVEQAIRKSGKTETEWAKSVNLEEPIDVVFENGKFYVDDGHHRYKASKILNKDLNINLEIKDKPIAKITGTKNYNYDDFVRGLWNKFNSKADDGVLGQVGKKTGNLSAGAIPTGGLLSMGESEETQADETEGLLKLNKTADKPMKGVLDGVADSKVQRGKNWDNLSSKIRNYVNVKTNNPGNLTFSKNPIDWDGGVDEHYETDKDKYYQFTTPEYGIRALTRDITNKRDKKGLDTIAKIIPVYSPKKSGNDPENYIRIVSQRTGIDRDAKLTDDDMMKIVKGITHMEGAGSLAYYTDDIVIKGIKMAYRNRYQNIND